MVAPKGVVQSLLSRHQGGQDPSGGMETSTIWLSAAAVLTMGVESSSSPTRSGSTAEVGGS